MMGLKYCPDCGIERTKTLKPGSCPCCYSKMEHKVGVGGRNLRICTNKECRRCISAQYLTGFWSAYREFILKETNYPNGTFVERITTV